MGVLVAKSEENVREVSNRGVEYRTNGYYVELIDEDGKYSVNVGDERGYLEGDEFDNLDDAVEYYERKQMEYDLPTENDYWNDKYDY
jgi:hypothetical protein